MYPDDILTFIIDIFQVFQEPDAVTDLVAELTPPELFLNISIQVRSSSDEQKNEMSSNYSYTLQNSNKFLSFKVDFLTNLKQFITNIKR